MRSRKLARFVCLNLLFGAAEPLSAGTPLGTGFTYHGRLRQSGQPLNGPADLTFALYDSETDGLLLGSQTLAAATITEGLFSVVLNAAGEFGSEPFNGDKRWLEVTVNGTALAPRQELTATPYALSAPSHSRSSLDAADGSPVDVVHVSNSGLVGVNMLSPQASLHIAARTITAFRADSIVTAFTDTAIHGISEDTAGRFDSSGSFGKAVHATASLTSPNAYAGYFEGQVYTNGFLYRGYTASSRSAAIPLAYGVVNSTGTIAWGTGNFTASLLYGGNNFGWYYSIAVNGESLVGGTAIITQYAGNSGRMVSYSISSGRLIVRFFTAANDLVSTQETFSFVLFAAAPTAAGGSAGLTGESATLAQPVVQDTITETPKVCSGNAVTDEQGYATIALPERFDQNAGEVRYQLTIVDDGELEDFVAVKVVRKITENRFTIRTSAPLIQVSWHVEHGS